MASCSQVTSADLQPFLSLALTGETVSQVARAQRSSPVSPRCELHLTGKLTAEPAVCASTGACLV